MRKLRFSIRAQYSADRYDYDLNGNLTIRDKGLSTQQTLTWDHENRLASLTATGLSESYLYDDAGIRVKKTSNGTTAYYPFPHYEVSGSTITKYYFFNGQRVAMKVGSTLTYLHQDHLSSTAFATNSSGVEQSRQGYFAYGKTRWGNLPTDHRFTGQKLDTATGLMYYGARYYDRHIGVFISPDTLVPDPTNLWDYNRFAYARLNPLKYNDPTGHCASYSNIGEEPQPKPGDGDCWGLVDHILGLWERDRSGYWQQRWVSQDIFRKYVAATPSNDSAFMLQEIDLYWNSETYLKWEQQQSKPTSTTSPGDLMCGGDPACQAVVQSAGQAVQYCTDNDCVAQSLDAVSTSAAGLAAICAAGIVTAPCSIPAAGISVAAGGAGTVWTGYQVWQGNGHEIDLATAAMTFTVGVKSNPYVGFVASLYQTYWDFRRPPLTNNQ